jgi:arginyl-tRNA synthetase
MLRAKLGLLLKEALSAQGVTDIDPILEHPVDPGHGDYATNVALHIATSLGKSPREVAEALVTTIKDKNIDWLASITVAGPGFINFTISPFHLVTLLTENQKQPETSLSQKRIMVEYAHPNTHKEMHIGHMRTLITGEALARLFEQAGATVFRANYQGDIGPHVAKALYGVKKLLDEKSLTIETVASWDNIKKAEFLGQAYVRGSQDYEANKETIDQINRELYAKQGDDYALYQTTRQWSLDYYDDFYKRFYTKFDRLFFESEMAAKGREIVEQHIGAVFVLDNGAIVFKGEEYGLHTRVFITQAGNPTYEGKEMGNAFAEYEAFPFDLKMHVVGSEQAGYFKVVFKALELIDPEKFQGKQHHVSMGMVQLTDRKMSSRTGDILRVDWLLDQIKERVLTLMADGRIAAEDKDAVAEQIVIGAVKYSVLKVSTGQDVSFDIEKSVSIDGDSGPYLQYTYARTQSVLRKSEESIEANIANNYQFQSEEIALLRQLSRFEELVSEAAEKYAPSMLCTYLFDLAQQFNLFYQKLPILKEGDETRRIRLFLTAKTGETLKRGLLLLGIQAPERM